MHDGVVEVLPQVFEFVSAFCVQDLQAVCSTWLHSTRSPSLAASWLAQFSDSLPSHGRESLLNPPSLLNFLRTEVLQKFRRLQQDGGLTVRLYVAARWGFDEYIRQQLKNDPSMLKAGNMLIRNRKVRQATWEAVPDYVMNGSRDQVGGDDGDTLLHVAATCGHAHVIRAIFAAVPHDLLDLENVNNFCSTALCTAAFHNQHAAVVALLEARANVEFRNGSFRQTALCIAASRGGTEVVRALLAHGADPLVADADGWDPVQIAVSKGHDEVRDILLLAKEEALARAAVVD
jgi:ankyrin repeat protein